MSVVAENDRTDAWRLVSGVLKSPIDEVAMMLASDTPCHISSLLTRALKARPGGPYGFDAFDLLEAAASVDGISFPSGDAEVVELLRSHGAGS